MSTEATLTAAGSAPVRRHVLAGAAGSTVRSPATVSIRDRAPAPPPAPPPVDVSELLEAFEGAVARIERDVRAALIELEREAVELAVAAAGAIVRRKVERGEHDLFAVLSELLDRYRAQLGGAPLTLRLHPDDAAQIQERALAGAGRPPALTLAPDPGLERGTLLLESGATALLRTLQDELRAQRRTLLHPAEDGR